MTTTAPGLRVDWDAWRSSYDQLGHREQQAFYDAVFDECRVQQQHNAERVAALLDHAGRRVTVVELGGWDGELAAAMLSGAKVSRWENWEISPSARRNPVCSDPRYVPRGAGRFYWETDHQADVFVASHVLEHLRYADVCRVLDRTDARWLYLDVPVTEAGRTWDGYNGSHILEVGWARLHANIADRGYQLIAGLSGATIRCYERPA